MTGTQSLSASGGNATTQFNSETISPSIGTYDTSTYTYTCNKTGYYLMSADLVASTSTPVVPDVMVNGTTVVVGTGLSSALLSPSGRGGVTGLVHLNSGDTVTIRVTNTAVAAATVATSSTWSIIPF